MKTIMRLVIFLTVFLLMIAGAFLLPSTPVILLGTAALFLIIIPRDMLKNLRMMIWIIFILLSIVLVAFNYNASGYNVVSLEKNSTVTNIAAGEVLYKINDVPVTAEALEQQYFGTIKLDTNRGQKFVRANGTLGIEASEVPSSSLRFGLDLKGGGRAALGANSPDKTTPDPTKSH